MRDIFALSLCALLFLAVIGCDKERARGKPVKVSKQEVEKGKPVESKGKSLEKAFSGKAKDEIICFEAEDFPEGGGWYSADNVVGYFGKGSIGSKEPNRPTEKLLDVSQRGEYSVWIRYAWRKKGAGRLNIDNWHADFGKEKEGTGVWKWVNLGICNLNKGEHVISIEDLGAGWTTVDGIILTLDEKFDPRKEG